MSDASRRRARAITQFSVSRLVPAPSVSNAVTDLEDELGAVRRPLVVSPRPEFLGLLGRRVEREALPRVSPARRVSRLGVVRPEYRAAYLIRDLYELRIRVPERVRFCVARHERREVLFALRRAGRGGSTGRTRYRRTVNSQYRC